MLTRDVARLKGRSHISIWSVVWPNTGVKLWLNLQPSKSVEFNRWNWPLYVTKKMPTMTDKMVVRKYDPVARKHVEYKEGKIK